jgi:hypothetical protein
MDNSIVLLFLDFLQPITNVVMCTLTMNILKPYAFNHAFKQFIYLFIKLHITIIIYPKSHPQSHTQSHTLF